jgi:hypothetical protein
MRINNTVRTENVVTVFFLAWTARLEFMWIPGLIKEEENRNAVLGYQSR